MGTGGNRPPQENLRQEPVTTGKPPAGTSHHGSSRYFCPKNALHHGISLDVHEPPRYPFFLHWYSLITDTTPSGTFACTILDMRLNVGFGRLHSCTIYQVPVSHTSTEHKQQKLSKIRHVIFRFSSLLLVNPDCKITSKQPRRCHRYV